MRRRKGKERRGYKSNEGWNVVYDKEEEEETKKEELPKKKM
jgi:hypothetical protein